MYLVVVGRAYKKVEYEFRVAEEKNKPQRTGAVAVEIVDDVDKVVEVGVGVES